MDNEYDIIIVGGGATGLGCAVDAASRGYKTLLVEKDDFGKGTSSKSTKLIHGGVRYLEQGNVFLVREALIERKRLIENASHLVTNLTFVIPNYEAFRGPYYFTGLKLYDYLSIGYSLGKSKYLTKKTVKKLLPNISTEGLKNGISYHDGQFDDTRLLVSLLCTYGELGGTALNYCKVTDLIKDQSGKVIGVHCKKTLEGEEFEARAKVVVNATGVFTEQFQKMDNPNVSISVTPSQGSHIVLNHKFLKSDKALMIPKTSDGRILFAVPWHNHTLVGTTDAYTDKISNDPTVTDKEIDFMLETANEYFDEDPTRDDILSCFAGIRPLVTKGNTLDTKSISRSHGVSVSKSGMVNITGGKWTTYRKMAEDTIDKALKVSTLSFSKCNTADLKLDHGGTSVTEKRLQIYGGFASQIMELERKDKKLAKRIHPDLPYTRAQVIWACDNELAMTVEDVLARRTRALFLNAKAAKQSAKKVAELMASTMDKSEQWQDQQVRLFKAFADGYLVS